MFKRGMSHSTVVVVLILMSLTLIAVAARIILPALSDEISGSSGLQTCLGIDLKIKSCTVDNTGNISVVVSRNPPGNTNFSGINFIFSVDEQNVVLKRDVFSLFELESRQFRFNSTEVQDVSGVDIGAILLNGQFCQPKKVFVQCTSTDFLTVDPLCGDGEDNDGDGWMDAEDPGCFEVQWQPTTYNITKMDEINPSTGNQCSDGIDNDLQGGIDGNDFDCVDWLDNTESSEPPCQDRLDNDGDGWIDNEDVDCNGPTDSEDWFALSACSDGVDNDRDGGIDSSDGECTDNLDNSEIIDSGNNECSDGIDNDNDGITDYPDPGCGNYNDDSESSEGIGVTTSHNFNYLIATSGVNQGLLLALNWTNGGSQKRIVWDEITRGLTIGNSRIFFHTTIPDSTYFTYQVGSSSPVSVTHSNVIYSVSNLNSDRFTVNAQVASLEIKDNVRLHGDDIYVSVSVKNNFAQDVKLQLPFYLGSLMIGNFPNGEQGFGQINNDPRGQLDTSDARLFRLRAGETAGRLEFNYTNPDGSSWTNYGEDITTYSPVTVLGDDYKATIGAQLLSEIYSPTTIGWQELPSRWSPRISARINTELKPGETKTFNLVFSLADGGYRWEEVLQPYKDWFKITYGGEDPSYCPAPPLGSTNGQNNVNGPNPQYIRSNIWRYKIGALIEAFVENSRIQRMSEVYGVNQYGIWGTALHSSYLINGCTGGNTNCAMEFNPRIDLIDPNLDLADPTKIEAMVARADQYNVDFYWFARPCATIEGADINGVGPSATFTKGTPVDPVDLREVENRDAYISYMEHFVSRGVKGFYFDAMDCPGDLAFTTYALNYFSDKYGVDLLIAKEGAIDRESLMWSQIPLVKIGSTGTYYYDNGQVLPFYLVPHGTYYIGKINHNLVDAEIDHALARGNQMVEGDSPPVDPLSTQGMRYCQSISAGYSSRSLHWNAYGSSIANCPAPPSSPPC